MFQNMKSQALSGLRNFQNWAMNFTSTFEENGFSFPAETTGYIPPPGPPCNIWTLPV